MIFDEVIVKQEQNLKAFCRGLDSLNIGSLIKKYPSVMKILFTAEKDRMITSTIFFSLMAKSDEPKCEKEKNALTYFKEFVLHIESEQSNWKNN